jgi:hypothetical protein
VVIGEVLLVHASSSVVDERYRVNPDALRAIGRMGGFGYCRTSDPANRFEMPMGRGALEGVSPGVQQPLK